MVNRTALGIGAAVITRRPDPVPGRIAGRLQGRTERPTATIIEPHRPGGGAVGRAVLQPSAVGLEQVDLMPTTPETRRAGLRPSTLRLERVVELIRMTRERAAS